MTRLDYFADVVGQVKRDAAQLGVPLTTEQVALIVCTAWAGLAAAFDVEQPAGMTAGEFAFSLIPDQQGPPK